MHSVSPIVILSAPTFVVVGAVLLRTLGRRWPGYDEVRQGVRSWE